MIQASTVNSKACYFIYSMLALAMSDFIKTVVLTISDSAARGEREDVSGPTVVSELASINVQIVQTEIIPDERLLIAER